MGKVLSLYLPPGYELLKSIKGLWGFSLGATDFQALEPVPESAWFYRQTFQCKAQHVHDKVGSTQAVKFNYSEVLRWNNSLQVTCSKFRHWEGTKVILPSGDTVCTHRGGMSISTSKKCQDVCIIWTFLMTNDIFKCLEVYLTVNEEEPSAGRAPE